MRICVEVTRHPRYRKYSGRKYTKYHATVWSWDTERGEWFYRTSAIANTEAEAIGILRFEWHRYIARRG